MEKENRGKEMQKMVGTLLFDGLDDEPTIDEKGYPVEMDSCEREKIEEIKNEESLRQMQADTNAFLFLGGCL